MYKSIAIIVLLLFGQKCFSQLPAKQVNSVGFKTEIYGGLILHTSGWGANLNYNKFITYKTKRMLSVDIVSMKHPKEIKVNGYLDPNSKRFVYGKLNSFMTIRLAYGKKYMVYEKLRDKGVDISWHWNVGGSFGFLKPFYLDILNIAPNGRILAPLQEPYNPEKHNLGNIYGRSKGMRGLAETKLIPGGFFKIGLEFEYNDDRETIKAIGTGFILDVYPSNVEIMAFSKNTFVFPSLYINLLIGQRYF